MCVCGEGVGPGPDLLPFVMEIGLRGPAPLRSAPDGMSSFNGFQSFGRKLLEHGKERERAMLKPRSEKMVSESGVRVWCRG